MIRAAFSLILLCLPVPGMAAVYISEIAWPSPVKISRCFLGLGKMGTVAAACILPHFSHAAVYISEIAWMGTSNSANDEWIELHNDGSGAVSLNDWRLTDGQNFDVTLAGAGSIAAGAYAVMERTDDSSAPGTAWYVYTGSLANTGATLRLFDAAGNLVDQVAGGENWENTGGDNTTKETAQYTPGGWITAAATPGSVNATEDSETEAETSTHTSQRSSSGSSSGPPARRTTKNASRQSDQPLELSILAPDVGFVAQPITFIADVSGRGASSRAGRTLQWNFGDTHTDTGSDVTHQYQYPGTYVVSLRGQYKRDEAHERQEITILPVQLAITRNRAGAVQISNTTRYEIALGGYTVSAAGTEYTFSPDTYLKADATITLPPDALTAATQHVVAVHDQAAQVVAYQVSAAAPGTNDKQTAPTETPETPTASLPAHDTVAHAAASPTTDAPPAETPGENFSFRSNPLPAVAAATTTDAQAAPSPNAANVIAAVPPPQTTNTNEGRTLQRYSLLALIGLLALAAFTLLSRRVSVAHGD